MKKCMYIDANPFERRLAVTENGDLAEFHIERKKDRGLTGNVYKGRVVRVLPGMQAAFVEIGLERTAFLHAADVSADSVDFGEEGEKPASQGTRIQDLLKQGQELVVQVEKEPMGTKGARLTSYVSLPGRYLVLMPGYERIGVSRRIGSERERRRLRDIVSSVRPPGYGFIIRTVCETRDKEEIIVDMNFLVKLWQSISKKIETSKPPSLIYEELDLTLRSIRDAFTPDMAKLLVEPKEEYDRAASFIEEFMPSLRGKVELYDTKDSMFDAHAIEVQLTKALSRKVWLPSGGHIVMDQMEALTAIDVNTGSYVGKKSHEDTILKTNIEAAEEIVRQLRLRNIGGIIVIDFIDMTREAYRDKVYKTFKDALKQDKAKTNILRISELGIIEMTRKRSRESISQSLLEPCPYCDGDGFVKGRETVAIEIYRDLLKELSGRKKAIVYANPVVASFLQESGGVVEEIKRRLNAKIAVKSVETFHLEEYEIF